MKLIRLQNHSGTKVDISPVGASIVNFFVTDHQGKERNIVLGYDSREKYIDNGTYFGAVVGPIANRVANGRFSIDGHDCKLTKNDGNNSLHGGEAELNSKVWEVMDRSDKSALLTVRVNKGEGGYPVDIVICVAYFLSDNNELSVRYTATPSGRCPLNITQHAYFNLNGGGDILEHELWIDSDRILAVDNDLIPTGFMDVCNSAFDFRAPRKIGVAMQTQPTHRQLELANGGYDHCYVLANSIIDKESMRVTSYDSGISLAVTTDLPGVQFYSGNFLDNEAGRNGDVYQKHGGLCLETQYFPNQVNTSESEKCIFDMYNPFNSTTVFTVSLL